MRILLLFLLPIAACKPDENKPADDSGGVVKESQETDTDTDTDTDSDTDSDTDADTDADTDSDADADPCTATVDSTDPADGATGVNLEVTPTVWFTSPATEVTLALYQDSTAVSGTTSLAGDGLSATFTPDDLLAYLSDYSLTTTVCALDKTTTFTTVEEPTDFTGTNYLVDMAGNDIAWSSPPSGVVSLLWSYTTNTLLIYEVESFDGATLDLIGAIGDTNGGNHQYACLAPIDYPAVSYTGGTYTVGPVDTTLSVNGVSADVYALTTVGSIAADGSEMSDVHVTALVDVGPALSSAGYNCQLLAAFGVNCVACGNGSNTCINLDFVDPVAPADALLNIDPGFPDLSAPECQ